MPDVWATVSQLDGATQERLAEVLETRGADPQQQAMRRAFLAEIAFPAQARELEVGCGTGVPTRRPRRWPEPASWPWACPTSRSRRPTAARSPSATTRRPR